MTITSFFARSLADAMTDQPPVSKPQLITLLAASAQVLEGLIA